MTDVNEQLAMMAAMGRVKDVLIDPNSGRAMKRSNKSILEKAGVEPVEYTQSLDGVDPVERKEYAKSNKKHAKDEISVYMESIYGTKPITENEEKEFDGPLGVGKRIDEVEYMANMVKKMKKSR